MPHTDFTEVITMVTSATNLAQWGSGTDELQDNGVGVLLDAMGYIAVHHNFVELIATRSNIIHQDLVWGEFVLDGGATVVDFLQFHPVTQLVDDLNPQPRL